jgi:CD63 antigen
MAEWDRLQQQWSCCGVDNSSDWINQTQPPTTPPNSCCLNNDCTQKNTTISPYFNPGCYQSVRGLFYRYSKALGGVSLFFFFVEIVGLILAVVLLRDLKNNYGSV